jgi:hypothetical protein
MAMVGGGEGDGQKVAAVESRRVHANVHAGASPLPRYLPPRPHPSPTITEQQPSWKKQLRYVPLPPVQWTRAAQAPQCRSGTRLHSTNTPTPYNSHATSTAMATKAQHHV